MQDDSYLVMRRSEREFVIEASSGDLLEAQAYCRRRNWKSQPSNTSPEGADLVIYKLVEVIVEK